MSALQREILQLPVPAGWCWQDRAEHLRTRGIQDRVWPQGGVYLLSPSQLIAGTLECSDDAAGFTPTGDSAPGDSVWFPYCDPQLLPQLRRVLADWIDNCRGSQTYR